MNPFKRSIILCLPLAALKTRADTDPSPPFRFQPNIPSTTSKIFKAAPGEQPLEGYTTASFPNPFLQPKQCTQMPRVAHSWLCDPDNLLTVDEQAFLESRLLQLRDTTQHTCKDGNKYYYQMAAAVANDIMVGDNETPQQAADQMAQGLLRQWGIGNRICHDGILLLYVKKHKIVSLATREGVEKEHIGDTFRPILEARMNIAYIATGSVTAAILQGIEMVNGHLPATKNGLGWVASLLMSFVGLYILSIVIVYFLLSHILKKRYHDVE